MSEPRRIRITHVHRASAHYVNRASIVGLTGMFEPYDVHHCPGYYAGHFYPDDKTCSFFFFAVRYKRI